MSPTRRQFLRTSAIIAASGAVIGSLPDVYAGNLTSNISTGGEFTLPPLPYAYDALEPSIDRMTMEIHHTKHHQAYVTNLNKAVKEAGITTDGLENLLKNVSGYPAAVRNNAGGHWNHSFFWKLMKPGGGGAPTGKTEEAIRQAFGSFDEFRTKLNEAGMKRFGSGWAWLVKDKDGKLVIGSTPNQDNPLMDVSDLKGVPLLGIDVWEHAYYLKYQNKRGDYLSAWWNLVDWDRVAEQL